MNPIFDTLFWGKYMKLAFAMPHQLRLKAITQWVAEEIMPAVR